MNLADMPFMKKAESQWYLDLADIQNTICLETHKFFNSKNLKTLFLPVTTGTISSPMGLGSDSLPVNINLFGIDTYLADSMQFLLEYACRMHNDGAYYLMPSFRGEKADHRHLSQFYHAEAEIVGDLRAAMDLAENYVKHLSSSVLSKHVDQIMRKTQDISHIESLLSLTRFPTINFEDAVSLLSSDNRYIEERNGVKVISHAGEKWLIDYFRGGVWLSYFETKSVPFYQASSVDKPGYSVCADLLIGIGEVVGCGQRHATYQDVSASLDLHEVLPDEYQWYLEMKKSSPLQTSGFGMGIERFLLWLLKHDDIRDCQILVRNNGEAHNP